MRGRVIALLLLAGTIVPANSAFASAVKPSTKVGADSIGIRLLGVPGASPDSLGRLYVVDQMAPGTSVTRTVEIYNTTPAAAEISVYAAGASIVRGNFAFAPADVQDELSNWTSASSKVVRLAPGTEAPDTLTINVPSSASAGERYAVLWAQVSALPATTGGVQLVNRVGVRMYVSIGPGGAARSNFEIVGLTAERSASGARVVVATVRNTGQATLDVTGDLTLSKGPDGLRAGPFAAELDGVLAPHSSEPVTARVDAALPRGPWRAHIALSSGFIHRSAVATITFPARAGPGKAASHLRTLIVLVLIALLTIAALGSLVLFGRRSHRGVHAVVRARRPYASSRVHPPPVRASTPGSPHGPRRRVSRARMKLNGKRGHRVDR